MCGYQKKLKLKHLNLSQLFANDLQTKYCLKLEREKRNCSQNLYTSIRKIHL